MNKIFSFLAAFFLIFVVNLFHFEAPPSASYDSGNSITTDALAASNDVVVDSNFGFGFKPAFNSQNIGDTSSKTSGTVFDPITMVLFGSGLIGLAGLGRKKI